jgi:phosphoenolpyruvate-protein kinase (PTS system EI component)
VGFPGGAEVGDRFRRGSTAAARRAYFAPMSRDLRSGAEAAPDPSAATADAPNPAAATPPAAAVVSLTGNRICSGTVSGVLEVVADALADPSQERVAREAVEDELNRFRSALTRSREQLRELRDRLSAQIGHGDARILDTHLALSKDSAFIADVENLIIDDQLRLDAAIGKVVGDFDRIFRLVKSEHLRQSAADLRDLGLRVLRNLEERAPEASAPRSAAAEGRPRILVARELSVVDLFDLERGRVAGLVAEGTGAGTHAAILARAMGVPTLTGVAGLFSAVRSGQAAVLDADSGQLHVADDPAALRALGPEFGAPAGPALPEREVQGLEGLRTADGEAVDLLPVCGTAAEVARCVGWGVAEVGLFRTELSFLLESQLPTVERLADRYGAVCAAAAGRRVTFRLLHADSTTPLSYIERAPEPNPALGCAGVRLLREHPQLLRAQLAALLRVGATAPLRIAIPFVDDLDQFAHVRDTLVAERLEQQRAGQAVLEDVQLGVVLDTPAALLGLDALCEHADFLIFHLDSLTQYVLAADRSQARHAAAFERLHPYLLRALNLGLETVRRSGVEFSACGSLAERPANVPLLLGLGFRRFAVAPQAFETLVATVGRTDLETAAAQVAAARRAPSARRGQSPVAAYAHGFGGSEGSGTLTGRE